MGQDLAGDAAHCVDYIESLSAAIGHLDRVQPMKDYCTGLLVARRAQERRADGRDPRPCRGFGTASVDAASWGHDKMSAL